ncbi:acyltransferase [Qipengyuania pelagi]|nr:acyltransferase [Qipengyuania pelagi]
MQAGRALAALAVVIHHANISATNLIGGAPRFSEFLGYGALGVDFFFVLSGFIIYYSSADSRPDREWVIGFLLRRGIRIYIPYWPLGIAVALFYLSVPGIGSPGHQFGWFSTLTLLPTDKLPALLPAWTLQHEVFFYLVFAMLIWMRSLWIGLAVWTLAMALLWYPNGPESNVMLASMNIEFVAGIMAAFLVMRDKVPTLLFSGLAIGFLVFYFVGGPSTNSLVFGMGVAFLVAVAASFELRGRIHIPSFVLLLGNASYAIYLIHNPLLAVTTRLVRAMDLTWGMAMAVGIAASTAAGIAYYFGYERPSLRFAHRKLIAPRMAIERASPSKS